MKKTTLQLRSFLYSIILFSLSLNCFSSTYTDTISNSKKTLAVKNVLSKDHISSEKKSFVYKQNSESEFTDEYLRKNFPVSSQTGDDLKTAMATCLKIDESGNLTDVLEPKKLSMLPLGIKKTIGGIQYLLGISNAKFTPEYTELTAFVRIIIPQHGADGKPKELFFGANNIRLSHKGGLVGDTNLVLLGDVPIKINGENLLLILKGGMDMKTGVVKNETYVTIDCKGFKELGISAEVQFSRKLLEPVDNNYVALADPALVKGTFKTVVSNWNDILIEISLPKFQLTSKKGFCFELNTAVIDFSDLRNSTSVVWPPNYASKYLVPGNENLWRGLYVQSLKIVLPEEFKKKQSKERIRFEATNLLIDRMGVSGTFSGTNLIGIDEGNASGWQMSLNSVSITLVANSLTAASFGGDILLPVSDKSEKCNGGTRSELAYKGLIDPVNNEYLLNAQVTNGICFQAFKAQAVIEKNSYVELRVKDGNFLPKAVLYGTLSLNASNKPITAAEAIALEKTDSGSGNSATGEKKETVSFKGVIFQNLMLQTVSPYISADYFGYKNVQNDGSTVSNFPVTINEIALMTTPESASLKVDLAINMMENQFNGQTKFYVVGKFGKDEGIQKWKYDHLKFEQISIGADLGGMKLKGSITIMDNDPVYGKGFKGMLSCDFTGGIKVEANAIFGSIGFRYWYVDAMVDGLNIPAGAITFKGFGGGAYYRMKKDGFSNRFAASGSNYVPDIDSGLGVKAMIKFAGTATADAFWGGAGFEIAFNSKGGINRVSIYGEGHVMQTFEIPGASELTDALKAVTENESLMGKIAVEALKTTNLSKAAAQLYPNDVGTSMGINAFAAIEYDFRAKTLHGSFDLYIATPGGFIQGRASGNRAGWAVLHFGPDKWYVRAGTPTDRLGIKLAIGSFEVEAGGYFMMGDDIPASPPPPDIVAKLLGVDVATLDYMRDENSVASGKGFAFGSDFSLKTGDLSFLMFYANFQAGFGFDIMVKDYGEAQCKGSGQIGLNGWYANGQSYAYLQGELGINIKLFFIRKKISIIKGGGAVLLQAKLPNPVWIRGYMAGYFDILGGAIKGSFRFKLEFGKQCEFVNDAPLGGLKSIADITPSEGAKDVDVFTVPQVGFNVPVEKNFTLEEDSGTKTYKLKLEEYTIKKDGVALPGQISWNDTKDLLSFTSTDILPPNSDLILTVKVSFQEYTNGAWKTVLDKGQIATETETRNFATGTAPKNIPVNNISYSYPVFDQKYVYQNESKQAYIVLKQGQPYLFDLKPGQSQQAFYKTGDNTATGLITYNNSDRKVSIDLPALQTSKPYNITLMTLETKTDANSNLSQNYESQDLGDGANIEMKSNTLNATVTSGEGVELLQYKFNTSQYNTFKEKMAAKKPKQTLVEIIYSDVHALQSMNNSTEPFDEIEIIGNLKSQNIPLVAVEAVLDDNYYKNEIFPLIYAGYPLERDLTLDRVDAKLGIPPIKGVETMAWYQDYILNNPSSFMLKEYLPYRYNLPYYYKTDFVNLRYKVVNKYLNTLNQAMITKYDYIINGKFPYIKQGIYTIKLNYTLPGGQAGTSSIFTFNKSN
ncbi:hypothetical protein SGQ44_06320 [Flavobacterium sp. Fl-77]|uniref:Uncharacterized protein n=1 Tax=Flavobacterium flavipigmentatum TaxID=2893884 RepID=A0AAJ2SFJ4_9FLAO|nr:MULTISPECIES: hypothetical protein [unclassified Flavobacterium]MDX6181602.1 hypothetical protein [Flavobacterium sp. Fl-33]MDX6185364.1 hypothetical protein [Flavobacterium sp. Fl-77]UFH37468.1 hypothetical protein LNP22_12050 [Flavobacterium sp. F-70]